MENKNFLDLYNHEAVESDYVLTTNGAVAYGHAHQAIVDFVFNLSKMRNAKSEYVEGLFSKILYQEGEEIACKFLMWVADCRYGAGERKAARDILHWLCVNRPQLVSKIHLLIPEYNRWDTLILLADPYFNPNEELRQEVVHTIKINLASDLNSYARQISLLGKWMPSENASSAETRRMAKQLIKDLGISPKAYRKNLSELRCKLRVVERDMSAGNWSGINYSAVPSKANLIYGNAFLRNDEERRRAFLERVVEGKATLHGGMLAPYEIVNKYGGSDSFWGGRTLEYDESLELLWKSLPVYQMDNTLVVRDGSGSMLSGIGCGRATALDVATSLAIYCSEHNSSAWVDKFITFSAKPQVVDLSKCANLKEKIELCRTHDECENTDIYRTMKLILDTAVKNHLSQEEMPQTILIISDMQFDGEDFNYNDTLFNNIKREFESFGYKLPRMVFWNVDIWSDGAIPMLENDMGLTLCSGFSTHIFRMVIESGITPYEQIISLLSGERYEEVEEALRQ